MRACKCPNCGANLTFDDEGREYIFCQFCGTKIDLMDQRTVHTEHIVDDAKIKNAESIHRIVNIFASPFEDHRRKKQAREAQEAREAEEAAEAARIREEKNRQHAEAFEAISLSVLGWCIRFVKHHKEESIAGVIAIALLISLASGASRSDARKRAEQAALAASSHIAMGELQFPDNATFTGDYRNTYKALKDAGFTNITLDPAQDLILGFLETENDIIEVTVDGAPSFDKDAWYPSDIRIVIKYHSFVTATSESEPNGKSSSESKSTQNASKSASTEQTSKKSSHSVQGTLGSVKYDACYVARGSEFDLYYAIYYNTNIVRFFTTRGESYVYLGHIVSGSLTDGMQVHYSCGDDEWDETLKYSTADSDKSIDRIASSSEIIQFSKMSSDGVRNILNHGGFHDYNPTKDADQYARFDATSFITSTASRIPSDKAVSDLAPKAPTTSYANPADIDYDDCYVIHAKYYDMYYAFDYDTNSVRSFTTDDTSVQVGNIKTGDLEHGMIVHYNYDTGWDEYIKYIGNDNSTISVKIANNPYTTTFYKASVNTVRKVLSSGDYQDMK